MVTFSVGSLPAPPALSAMLSSPVSIVQRRAPHSLSAEQRDMPTDTKRRLGSSAVLSLSSATRVLVATTPVDLRGSFGSKCAWKKELVVCGTSRSRRKKRGDLHSLGQLPSARDQPVRLSEGFIHTPAIGQDHPNQRIPASGLGKSEGEISRSGGLIHFHGPSRADERSAEKSRMPAGG
jgi:hypothetical protein